MILLDTNILVFAHNTDSPHYQASLNLLQDALSKQGAFCLAPQNLFFFLSPSVPSSPKANQSQCLPASGGGEGSPKDGERGFGITSKDFEAFEEITATNPL